MDYLSFLDSAETKMRSCQTLSDAMDIYRACNDFQAKLDREIVMLSKRKEHAKNTTAIEQRIIHLGALQRKASNMADQCFFLIAHTVAFGGTEPQYAIFLTKLSSRMTATELANKLGIGESTYYRYWADLKNIKLVNKEAYPAWENYEYVLQ